MSYNYAFYIHHHGSGHLMRSVAIARNLPKGTVSFLGSGLARYKEVVPDYIQCIELPGDMISEVDKIAFTADVDFLHYVPINLKSAAERTAKITVSLNGLFPVLLIVDVSVEIALLAALTSIPTVVIRQNGDRNDLAHLNAYQSARMLLAPCTRDLMNPSANEWVDKKTYFSGGFSRYTGICSNAGEVNPIPGSIGVMTGMGGTSLGLPFVRRLAEACKSSKIHVIGSLAGHEELDLPDNVHILGSVQDPLEQLRTYEVIIGNAGHNTVMEMADLNKYFICIPETRPFNEQFAKAKLLQDNKMAIVVHPHQIMEADWEELVSQAKRLPSDRWNGVINQQAPEKICEELVILGNQLFGNT
ncbi:hypothetical protein L0657_21730 [Dyadobacter sp. CY345]|uniref:glycosyltransferase n=1 Tax=Dyadobacter sp. CY345 TaxID=2909335 RepID=UPI001F452D29|nr:glycosyltransferase [Dyadobacter sp. CY345]MCF2446593.1 hypothetical protein [Dyadobacter sp. CY345]